MAYADQSIPLLISNHFLKGQSLKNISHLALLPSKPCIVGPATTKSSGKRKEWSRYY